jgi:hypothetical protein
VLGSQNGKAKDRPDAFLPDLARSLNNLGAMLSELGRCEEALEAIGEVVKILTPFFLALPAAYAPWMTTMVRNYLQQCQEAEMEPDQDLLEPLVDAFGKLNPPDGEGH